MLTGTKIVKCTNESNAVYNWTIKSENDPHDFNDYNTSYWYTVSYHDELIAHGSALTLTDAKLYIAEVIEDDSY